MVKKMFCMVLCLCLCVSVLTGCGCKHEWMEASCTAPKTCNLCGETEGEVLAHSFNGWVDVDAETEERTCSVCDYSEQQTVDREAKLYSILEGHWIDYGSIINGQFLTYEYMSEISDGDIEEGNMTFDFDSQGNVTYSFTDSGDQYNLIFEDISFSMADGYVQYDFKVKAERIDMTYTDFGIGCLGFAEGEPLLCYSLLGDYSVSNTVFKKVS